MSRRVTLFVAFIVATAVVATIGLYANEPSVETAFFRAAVVFFTLGTFAEFLSYELTRGAKGSVGFIPYLALVALSPNWVAVVAVAGSIIVINLIVRRTTLKAIFNTAQHAVAVAAAAVSYQAAGGQPMLQVATFAVIPLLAMLAAFTFVNSAAVSTVIALNDNRNVGAVWRDNTARTLPYDLLSLPVVFVFAWVYVNYGATGVALLAVPMLGVRQLYLTNWQLEKTNQELLELMVAAIEARDPYTSGHSRRVSQFSKVIARAIGLGSREIERVGVAALLHDVGKIHEVFAPILRKPDRLSPEEWEIMKTHPVKSAELVQHVSQLKDVVEPLRHHHENWDGTGYPDGLAGNEIPLYARVIMFADTIDAMTTDRPYRAALGEPQVRAELKRMKGRQFDPQICEALLESPLFASLFQQGTTKTTPKSLERLSLALSRGPRRFGT